MWRRSLFVVIAFCLLDYPGLQVQLLLVSAITSIMFLLHGVKYQDGLQYFVEVINELSYLTISYAFMLCNMSGSIKSEIRF